MKQRLLHLLGLCTLQKLEDEQKKVKTERELVRRRDMEINELHHEIGSHENTIIFLRDQVTDLTLLCEEKSATLRRVGVLPATRQEKRALCIVCQEGAHHGESYSMTAILHDKCKKQHAIPASEQPLEEVVDSPSLNESVAEEEPVQNLDEAKVEA